MKIAIFTRGLSNVMGGMERQLLSIASGYVDRGHEVTVISLDSGNLNPFFDADPRLVFIGLSIGDSSKKASISQRYLRQKRVFELLGELESDLALTFMTGSFWFAAIPAKLRRVPIILSERTAPPISTRTRVKRIRYFIFATMILANAITVQFESYRKGYPFFLRKKIIAIPNKIPLLPRVKPENKDLFTFLFAGRLSNQKQINELALAFVEFNKEHQNTKLEIFGEGEQFPVLSEIIKNNKAESFIELRSPTKDITSALATANVMMAPSLWEGFPNSVAEALASGVPVGGFKDCEGVRDLIIHGKNGWIIDRQEPIKSQIELLKTIYSSRDEMAQYSVSAESSVKQYQGEEPNEKWSYLASSLLLK